MPAIPPKTSIEGLAKSAEDLLQSAFNRGVKHGWYLEQQERLEEKRRWEEELEQVSNKLSELLSYVTGGRFSKTSYTIEDMKRFADDYQQVECAKCKLQMGEWSSEED